MTRRPALRWLPTFVTSLAAATAFAFSVQSSRGMPSNAVVFLDDSLREYFSPPCIEDVDVTYADLMASHRFRGTRNREIPADYAPNDACREADGFHQADRSAGGLFLQRVGLLQPIESRWNHDGTWRW